MKRFPENDIISLMGVPPRYELGESTGPDLRLADLFDADTLGSLPLGYGTAAGDPELRAAIAAAYGVAPDDVVVTAGGMHALFLLAFVLCERGAETVITNPCFPLSRNALAAVGAEIRVLPLSFDQGYRLDPRDLRTALSPQTKLVSLASPQNPSGVAISFEVLRETLALMQEISPDAYLLVDETYRDATYADDPVAETALALGPKVISVASLSKCHGAPGLRIGWAITAMLSCDGSWWWASSTPSSPAHTLMRCWRSSSSSAARRITKTPLELGHEVTQLIVRQLRDVAAQQSKALSRLCG